MPTLSRNGHLTDARLDGRCIEVSRAETAKDAVVSMRVPFYDLERVVVIGQAGLTTPLLQKLATEGIPLHLLSGHGRWLGAFYPNANGHALRRLRQYDLARNGHFSLGLAAAAVVAKLRNSRRVLQRLAASRNESADPKHLDVCNSLQALLRQAEEAESFESLRGYEGSGALPRARARRTPISDWPSASRSMPCSAPWKTARK